MMAHRRPSALAASLLILTLACGPSGPPAAATLRVLWEEDETDTTGRISGDGTWLSYVSWTTGDLAMREIATGLTREITQGPGDFSVWAGVSAFARQGDRIAFEWNGASLHEVRVAPLSGGMGRVVLADADLYDWSEEGDSLLVRTGEGLGFVAVATGGIRGLLNSREPLMHARLSPDGSLVAFGASGVDPTLTEVHLVSTVSGERRTFVAGQGRHSDPTWSEDGASLVYLSDRGGVPRLWRKELAVMNAEDPGEPIADMPDAFITVLGADASGTVYVGTEDREGQDVYIGDVDWQTDSVRNVTKVVSPPFRGSRRAVFAPSGSRIAFLEKGRGALVLPGWQTPTVRDLATGAERSYPTRLTLRDEPLWAPDESALYFTAPQEGGVGDVAADEWAFYRLDLETGSYTVIGRAAIEGEVRMIGARGRSIVYMLNVFGSPGDASVFELDLASAATERLVHIPGNTLSDGALAPDGSQLALALDESDGSRGLYVVAPGERPTTPIANVRPNARAQLMWFASGDAIISSGRVGGRQGIWRIPTDGSTPEVLNVASDDVTEVRLSPDGRRIAFTRRNQNPRQLIAVGNAF